MELSKFHTHNKLSLLSNGSNAAETDNRGTGVDVGMRVGGLIDLVTVKRTEAETPPPRR